MVLNLLFASIRAVVKVQFVVQIIVLPIGTFLLLYSLLENNFRRVLLRIVTLYIKIFNLKTSELS
mgnify:CR=1 FL=1